jgi:hypothetical protein
MNCSQYDVKGYFLNETSPDERTAIEAHLEVCGRCREELERLKALRVVLAALPEEEPPRRLAFVSDRVFEPSLWARFWNSTPRLVFASAALLAIAIVAHGWIARPPAPAPAPDVAAIRAQLQAELSQDLQAAVEKAVAEATARHERRTAELLQAAEQRYQQQRLADRIAFEEAFEVLQKRMNVYRASLAFGSAQ